MTLVLIVLGIVAIIVAIPFVIAISSAVIASSKMIIIAIPTLIIASMVKRLFFGKDAYIEPEKIRQNRRHKKKAASKKHYDAEFICDDEDD